MVSGGSSFNGAGHSIVYCFWGLEHVEVSKLSHRIRRLYSCVDSLHQPALHHGYPVRNLGIDRPEQSWRKASV